MFCYEQNSQKTLQQINSKTDLKEKHNFKSQNTERGRKYFQWTIL